MSNLSGKFSGYKVAFGCFLIMFVHLGVLGSVGIFMPHLVADLAIPTSQVSLVVTFATSSAFISSLFATKVIKKISARWAFALSTIICSLHYVVFGLSNGVVFIWLGGTMAGVVMGFGTNVATASLLSEWFIEKRATVIGIVFGGAGFGGAIAMFLAGLMIEKYDWRTAYFVFAAGIMLIGLLANLFFLRTPAQLNQKPLGWEKAEELAQAAKSEKQVGLMYDQAKSTATFKYWWLGLLFATMTFSTYTSFAPTFWQSEGMLHSQSSLYISLLSLFGAASVMLSGRMADRYGVKFYMSYPLIAFLIGSFLFVTLPNTSPAVTLITIIFLALGAPTSVAYPATITPAAFGNRDYAQIQGQLMAATYLGKAIAPIVMGQLDNLTNSLRAGFITLMVFAIIAFILLHVGFRKAPVKDFQQKAVKN